VKNKIINLCNQLLFKKNLRIMRLLKHGKQYLFFDLKTHINYYDIEGEPKYVIKKNHPIKDKEKISKIENWVEYFLLCQSKTNVAKLLYFFNDSFGQLKQDLFVLSYFNFKEKGFFIEFGAADGINLSNTFLLEKEFKWDGIVAEPAKKFHDSLFENRNCFIETDCVWDKTGVKVKFVEDGLLSTIDEFKCKDMHSRNSNVNYMVNTISLNNLLEKYDAPKIIDYLSIDTEGSEYEILKSLDFKTYTFKIITVEHNYTENRDKIYNLLTENGFKRVYTEITDYDDWYVLIS
jgi:FkbM family methyltransferase